MTNPLDPDVEARLYTILKTLIKDSLNSQLTEAVFVPGTRPQVALGDAKTTLTCLLLRERVEELKDTRHPSHADGRWDDWKDDRIATLEVQIKELEK